MIRSLMEKKLSLVGKNEERIGNEKGISKEKGIKKNNGEKQISNEI